MAASIQRQQLLLNKKGKAKRELDKQILKLRILAEKVGKKEINKLNDEKKLKEFLGLKGLRYSRIGGRGSTTKVLENNIRMGAGLRELQPAFVDAIRRIKETEGNTGSYRDTTTSQAIAMLESAGIVETKYRGKGGKMTIKIKDHKRLNESLTKHEDGYCYIKWDVKLKE